jgi:hypothetical protein
VIAVSTFSEGTLGRLIHLSRSVARLTLSGPRAIDFVKTVGCDGKMWLTCTVSSLELTKMFGCAIRFSFDAGRVNGRQVNFIEKLVTRHVNLSVFFDCCLSSEHDH